MYKLEDTRFQANVKYVALSNFPLVAVPYYIVNVDKHSQCYILYPLDMRFSTLMFPKIAFRGISNH